MITATFIFKPQSYDAEFQSLDERIEAIAVANEGYLGRKRWSDPDGNRSVVYYWRSMEDLALFQRDSTHRLAKSRYTEWYAGYRVEIAEVTDVYGDGYFDKSFPSEEQAT